MYSSLEDFIEHLKTEKPQPHFFGQDDSGHWYMVPSVWREEFSRLAQMEEGWDTPEWQKFEDCRLGGGIENVNFYPA